MQSLVFPGSRLAHLSQYLPGQGVYPHADGLYASLVGAKHVEGNLISVRTITPTDRLKVGAKVAGTVVRIREDSATLRLLEVEGERSKGNLEGVILKEHVREKEVDTVRMDECYLPGDVVEARVLSFGDGKRVFLSTREDGLGVRWGKGRLGPMLAVGDGLVECPLSGEQAKRKAALK